LPQLSPALAELSSAERRVGTLWNNAAPSPGGYCAAIPTRRCLSEGRPSAAAAQRPRFAGWLLPLFENACGRSAPVEIPATIPKGGEQPMPAPDCYSSTSKWANSSGAVPASDAACTRKGQLGRKFGCIRKRARWTGVAQAKIRNAAFRLHPVHDKGAKEKLLDYTEKFFLFGRRHDVRPEDESAGASCVGKRDC